MEYEWVVIRCFFASFQIISTILLPNDITYIYYKKEIKLRYIWNTERVLKEVPFIKRR